MLIVKPKEAQDKNPPARENFIKIEHAVLKLCQIAFAGSKIMAFSIYFVTHATHEREEPQTRFMHHVLCKTRN
jgi:hypothetical protein